MHILGNGSNVNTEDFLTLELGKPVLAEIRILKTMRGVRKFRFYFAFWGSRLLVMAISRSNGGNPSNSSRTINKLTGRTLLGHILRLENVTTLVSHSVSKKLIPSSTLTWVSSSNQTVICHE